MQVLRFWSDAHRETSVDVFVSEPFAFDAEALLAVNAEVISARFLPSRTGRLIQVTPVARRRGTSIIQSTTLTLPHPLANLATSYVNLIDTFRDDVLLRMNKYF
jgi:hypothetical protein